jgi:hypothetical protein
MAAVKALDPAPHVELPPDTPEVKLVAVEAGRSSEGLVARSMRGTARCRWHGSSGSQTRPIGTPLPMPWPRRP